MDYAWGYATDRRLRERNEDSLGVYELPNCTLVVVCDGMGGHAGGDQASAIAVRVIHDTLVNAGAMPLEQALGESVQAANRAVYEVSRKVRRLLGMGTTVAAIAVSGTQAWVAHVGDSRVYRIRGSQSKRLTRDHTMVNLFVDAELLSPDDAQSHPEAHILARSVGVDRHVDVDVSGPHQLRSGDILFACSDGVSGCIDDDEFAEADWTTPQHGVEQILKVVRAREGDDNATIAAIGLGFSALERMPPSALPSPEVLSAIGMSNTDPNIGQGIATPVPQAPRPAIRMPSMEGGAFVLEAAPAQETEAIRFTPAHQRPETPAIGVPKPDIAPDVSNVPQATTADPQPNRLPLFIAIAAAAGVLVLVGAFLARQRAQDPNAPITTPAATVQVLTDTTVQDPSAEPIPDQLLVADDADTEAQAEMMLSEEWRYAPRLPRRNQRVPHRPSRYLEPPPGGPMQLEAVLAARNRECPEALRAVMDGMAVSTDFATLYPQAWDCFNETHQNPLARQDVRSVEDFEAILVHFQGFSDTNPAANDVPSWLKPPRGGIEYRLEALSRSTDTDLFADVILDRIGGSAVAESLVRDAALEVQAATALASVDEPSDTVVEWWARRAFYGAKALDGLSGELIAQYRPEQRERMVDSLDAATGGLYSDPEATPEAIPEPVARAMRIFHGLEPNPSQGIAMPSDGTREPAQPIDIPEPAPVVAPRPAPAPEPEPDTEAVDPNARPIVHRGGENPMPEDLREP